MVVTAYSRDFPEQASFVAKPAILGILLVWLIEVVYQKDYVNNFRQAERRILGILP